MTESQTPSPRFIVEELGSALEIRIPPGGLGLTAFFWCGCLLAWGYGESGLLQSHQPIQFVLLWSLAGVFSAYQLLWQCYGVELVRIEVNSLFLEKQLLGLRRRQEYAISSIRWLRVYPPSGGAEAYNILTRVCVAFKYRIWTVRLGAGLSEEDCRALVQVIGKRFRAARGGA